MSLPFKVVLLAGTLCSTAASAHEFSSGAVVIDHPWARVTAASAPVAGAYLTVTNTGSEPDRLLGGSTPIASRIEIHQMTMDDGVARMRALPDGAEIAPGATIELAPGGMHLMLIGPDRQLVEGDSFKATLEFTRSGTIDVEFVIQRTALGGATGDGEHAGHKP